VPVNKSEYFDLYDSAEGHPYLKKRGVTRRATKEMELLLDPGDGGEPRILFPVYGLDKQLYGFSGRAVSPTAKLKVKDYHGLPKKRLLLGAHLLAKEDPFVVLVEGLIDYARMRTLGYAGLAFMSSTLTEWQADILKSIGKPVYFFHDDDVAGRDARSKAKGLLWRHVPVMKVRYPKDSTVETPEGGLRPPRDPAELTAEQVREMIDDARFL
jgi:DNA primase